MRQNRISRGLIKEILCNLSEIEGVSWKCPMLPFTYANHCLLVIGFLFNKRTQCNFANKPPTECMHLFRILSK